MSTTRKTTASRTPGKRGPKPRPAETVRSRLVHTRLTPGQYDDLADRADALGLGVSAYLQVLATGKPGSTAAAGA